MKRIVLLSVCMALTFICGVSQGQTLQSAYNNDRIIQTAPSAPIVIKAGAGAEALQIWEKSDGYGYLEFYNSIGAGPQRAIYGYDSALNFSAPYHRFNGNVGLGASNPGAKLSFNNLDDGTNGADGITWFSPTPLVYGIHRTPGSWVAPNYQQLRLSWDTGVVIDPGILYGKSYVDIQGNGLRVTTGNVGIGTIDTKGYKLAVAGKIRAQEIKVETANWPDYVFTRDYQLPTLQETKKYINENGHLPGIPSAEEVKANGINLGEMNAKLLQKIEEMTLYLIEIKKENEDQRLRNLKQQNQISDQQKDIELLKSKIK